MCVQKAEDWPSAFEACVNAGDVDAALALYETDCAFVAPDSAATIVGREGIRPALVGLVDHKVRMHGRVIKTVVAGDIALLYTDWDGSAAAPPHRAVEVLQRQPDGNWKLVIGDPNGRKLS
jgi:ketosteroid isomerase-like protein